MMKASINDMEPDNLTCPRCLVNGKDTILKLYQINFSEAVYLCTDKTCKYPKGYDWIIINRPIDISSDESDSESNIKNEPKHGHLDELNFLINKYEKETEESTETENKTSTWNEIASLLGFTSFQSEEYENEEPHIQLKQEKNEKNSVIKAQESTENVDEIASELLEQLTQINDDENLDKSDSSYFLDTLDPEFLETNDLGDPLGDKVEEIKNTNLPIVLNDIKILDPVFPSQEFPEVKYRVICTNDSEAPKVKIEINDTNQKDEKGSPQKRSPTAKVENVKVRKSSRTPKPVVMKDFYSNTKKKKAIKIKEEPKVEPTGKELEQAKLLLQKRQEAVAVLQAMKRGYK